ncbi:MAG: phosphatidylglycerophosphatase A [Bdellovibrionales bacterium]|nr:phosphatidylglycerophosphatase A [Bdellovibrionales bacterium]
MQDTGHKPPKKTATHMLAMLIATALGSGFVPKAPGTAGTVVGVAIVVAWYYFALPGFGIFAFALFLVGWWSSLYWSRYKNQTDCQQIVIDEVLGYFVTLGFFPHSWTVLLVGFVLFRIFDAWKPWPIRTLDRWGKNLPIGPAQAFMVIFDDLLAGIWSWLILFVGFKVGLIS